MLFSIVKRRREEAAAAGEKNNFKLKFPLKSNAQGANVEFAHHIQQIWFVRYRNNNKKESEREKERFDHVEFRSVLGK